MKTVVDGMGLTIRLGMIATALLLSQQVLALGTDAGTSVANQATVAYDVNSQVQTPIESDPLGNSVPGSGSPTTFLVDRRVDFTIVEVGGLHTEVEPGDVQAFAEFTLTNTGNAIMDFDLSYVDLTSGDPAVHGELDTDDLMSTILIRAGNGGGVPVIGDLAFVDELAEDASVTIYVFADAGATLPNDAYDNFTLNATAADDPDALPTVGTLDPLLLETPGVDDPDLIENVFANASGADTNGNATEGADDGFHVSSAELVITKTAAVFSDDFGSGKALPNAVIEYTVTIDNSAGLAIAENVVLTDTIQIANVALEDEAYGVDQDVSINGAFCNADLGDTTPAPDGCAYDAGTGALSIAVPDIGIGATTTVTYQVRISPL